MLLERAPERPRDVCAHGCVSRAVDFHFRQFPLALRARLYEHVAHVAAIKGPLHHRLDIGGGRKKADGRVIPAWLAALVWRRKTWRKRRLFWRSRRGKRRTRSTRKTAPRSISTGVLRLRAANSSGSKAVEHRRRTAECLGGTRRMPSRSATTPTAVPPRSAKRSDRFSPGSAGHIQMESLATPKN